MKCPACGFETPEQQGYCDFCKEPFRRAKPAPVTAPASEVSPPPKPQASPLPHPEAAKKTEIPPEVLLKLREIKKEALPANAPSGPIPPEFAGLDAGERIPVIASSVRKIAWAFFAVLMIWVGIATAMMIIKGRQIAKEEPPPAGRVQ